MNLPGCFATRFLQSLKEQPPVLVIVENVLTPITPIHEMIDGTFVLRAELSGHEPRNQLPGLVSILGTDPFRPLSGLFFGGRAKVYNVQD
jgi:hypothetical protein